MAWYQKSIKKYNPALRLDIIAKIADVKERIQSAKSIAKNEKNDRARPGYNFCEALD